MKADPPPAVGLIKPRRVLPSHTSCSRSVAPPGIWATVQSRIAVPRATTSTCRKKYRKAESDGGRLSSIPNDLPCTAWWRRAKRSRFRRLSQPLRIPSTATSNRYQAGIRTPRRIRATDRLEETDQIEIGCSRAGFGHREGAILLGKPNAESSGYAACDTL